MYKEQRTELHLRDQRGNVYVPMKQKKEKSAAASFVSVAVTTLALGLTITGLLLNASMKNNARNLAKIGALESEISVVRTNATQPKTPSTPSSVTLDSKPSAASNVVSEKTEPATLPAPAPAATPTETITSQERIPQVSSSQVQPLEDEPDLDTNAGQNQ
jgi:hypothetical protein